MLRTDNRVSLSAHRSPLFFRRGQAFLGIVIIIGGIIAVIAISFAILISSFSASSYGFRTSQTAEAVANAGVQDAVLQLERNSSYATSSYSVAVGSSTATVSVTQGSPSSGFVTIQSTAVSGLVTRQVTAVFVDITSTEQLSPVSWQITE